ncbi:helix-turn-helix domain-containing protein [Anaerocolumna sp.]|uniref:helix-turn-helix domain-containing protein n=1 Tax=Anaerocolumna sp. TaxID=2041569 RepID=UPI0028AA57F0|nr:helix-turn-helix domain-containing protein [Anaerocolumna sp.]
MAEAKVSRELYLYALKKTNFNKKAMARLLGVQRCTIYYWTEKLVKQGVIDYDGNILQNG